MTSSNRIPLTRGLLKSLYWRISATFLLILLVLAVVYVYVTAFTAEMYFQEANQRMNASVAEEIVQAYPPFRHNEVDTETLNEIFRLAKIINPSIEVYLLNPEGNILSSSPEHGALQLDRVSMEPIRRFLSERGEQFTMGDDPKNAKGEKVFTAAAIQSNDTLRGYLYVILGSEQYDSAAEFLLGSYILRIGFRTMAITLLAAAFIGMAAIAYMTKSLRTITKTVKEFQSGNLEARISLPSKGEMTEVAETFNEMADTIVRSIQEIKTMDTLRRELVANVSHDLRTPLASIHGYVETVMMKSHSLSAEERQRYLTTVLTSTEKLRRLVEELFELSKLEAKQTKPVFESFSIAELVQDVTQKFQVLAQRRNISITCELPRDLPPVTADIALIERVLQNLVDNAIKFTPDHGSITLSLRRTSRSVDVRIADTGSGISPEDLPYVFDRYHTGRSENYLAGTGAGLGLAIVKKILEAHAVSISVSSEVRKGTEFAFQLPASSLIINHPLSFLPMSVPLVALSPFSRLPPLEH